MKNLRFQRSPLALALAAALLAAPVAGTGQDEFTLDEPTRPPPDPEVVAELTQVRNWVEIGAGWVSDDSFRFGRYNGLQSEGGYGVLSLEYLQRGPYDGDDATYLHVSLSDLGLETREAAIEYGRQGVFEVRAGYDGMAIYRSDSARTPFNGAGGTRLTLPADWVPGSNTAGMTNLLPSLRGVSLEQHRQRASIGFDRHLAGAWTFSTDYSEEDRSGLKSIGGVIGNSGGNPRAVLLPEPIDYRTRQIEATASYAAPRTQLQLRYHASLFDNSNAGLVWQNPYSAISGWDPTAGFPDGFGQLALPPDNEFHQVSASGGYDFGRATRLTADLALGRMTQDDDFLPYTVNPALAAGIVQPLPRSSLDGQIDTAVFNLRLSSRAGSQLHWNASYRYDDRDNQTPRDEYVYIGGDSQQQDARLESSRRRFNEPYSYRDQRLRLDGGYRFSGGGGRLTGAAEHRRTERTFSEREEAREDTFKLGYSNHFTDRFGLSARLSRADRSGSTYHGEEPFHSSYSPDYVATVSGGWENIPGLRKFHQADRDRTQYALTAQFTPSERWALSLDAQRTADDYDASEFGLQEADIRALTLDASYTPSTAWSAHAWYSRENLDFDQDGQSIQGGGNRIPSSEDPGRAWSAAHRDRVDSAGAGFDWWPIERRLRLGADLLHVRSRGDIDVVTGAALSSAPLPTVETRLRSLGLRGSYRLRHNLALNLRYWYEYYDSSDWALDIPENQLANVILLGESSPDYRVHVVTASVTFTF
ncbi:MAG TPA: MtrB/PioB family decaheme-associated outer membrane protein [Xanthomonadaceae bacterium]|nr:MtrB/PioB family decaheme-associated outer membrane protein [Xanthomonadaceae bacterium]